MSIKTIFSVATVAITYYIFVKQAKVVPQYKLTYFNIPGLAEPIRFLLSYGKLDFEDKRIEKVDWPNLKPTMPYGQLPVLEIDGKPLHQSVAICRYVAKQVNLIGSNDVEDLEIDAAVDTINDFRLKIRAYAYEADPTIKLQIKEKLLQESIPFYIGRLEKQVKSNNGFIAVGKLTWADFYFAALLDGLNTQVGIDLTESAPNLRAVKEKIYSLPEIQTWLQKHSKIV